VDEIARHVGRIASLDIRDLPEQLIENGTELCAAHMSA